MTQDQSDEEMRRMRFGRVQMQSIRVLRICHPPNTWACIASQGSQQDLDGLEFLMGLYYINVID